LENEMASRPAACLHISNTSGQALMPLKWLANRDRLASISYSHQ